jgi:hypothetical protein
MASARAMIERRRSSRLASRIPLTILDGSEGDSSRISATAVAVSRCGALFRVPFEPEVGSHISVINELSRETREFRVVRVSPPRRDGTFEVGVEILHPNREFWGVRFPDGSTPDGEAEFAPQFPRAC